MVSKCVVKFNPYSQVLLLNCAGPNSRSRYPHSAYFNCLQIHFSFQRRQSVKEPRRQTPPQFTLRPTIGCFIDVIHRLLSLSPGTSRKLHTSVWKYYCRQLRTLFLIRIEKKWLLRIFWGHKIRRLKLFLAIRCPRPFHPTQFLSWQIAQIA